MKKIIFVAAVLSIMLVSNVSQAQPRNIRHAQYNQHSRIQQGVRSGQLTRGEAHHLRMQQGKVRAYKRMAMADGHISPAERRMIHHEQARAGRSIYYDKHNGRVRRYH